MAPWALPYGAAHGVSDAMRIMSRPDSRESADLADLVRRAGPAVKTSPKLSIWHGQADAVVNVANATDLARQWAAAGGLAEQPDVTTTAGRTTQSVWRGPDGEAQSQESKHADHPPRFPRGRVFDGCGPALVGAVDLGLSTHGAARRSYPESVPSARQPRRSLSAVAMGDRCPTKA